MAPMLWKAFMKPRKRWFHCNTLCILYKRTRIYRSLLLFWWAQVRIFATECRILGVSTCFRSSTTLHLSRCFVARGQIRGGVHGQAIVAVVAVLIPWVRIVQVHGIVTWPISITRPMTAITMMAMMTTPIVSSFSWTPTSANATMLFLRKASHLFNCRHRLTLISTIQANTTGNNKRTADKKHRIGFHLEKIEVITETRKIQLGSVVSCS